jgi:hypothetical protein
VIVRTGDFNSGCTIELETAERRKGASAIFYLGRVHT